MRTLLVRMWQGASVSPMRRRWWRHVVLVFHHGLHGTPSAVRCALVVWQRQTCVVVGVILLQRRWLSRAVVLTATRAQRRDLVCRVGIGVVRVRRLLVLGVVELLVGVLAGLLLVCVLSRNHGRRVGVHWLVGKRLLVTARRLEVVLRHGPAVAGVSHMRRHCVGGLHLVGLGRGIRHVEALPIMLGSAGERRPGVWRGVWVLRCLLALRRVAAGRRGAVQRRRIGQRPARWSVRLLACSLLQRRSLLGLLVSRRAELPRTSPQPPQAALLGRIRGRWRCACGIRGKRSSLDGHALSWPTECWALRIGARRLSPLLHGGLLCLWTRVVVCELNADLARVFAFAIERMPGVMTASRLAHVSPISSVFLSSLNTEIFRRW
jgi:hypothetical protein